MAEGAKLKVPPYSDEAERSVLGCMLLDRDSVSSALQALREDDFYVEQNRIVFRAIQDLNASGFAIDTVTAYDRVASSGNGEKVTAAYMAGLAEAVVFTSHIEEYCRMVYEKSMLRSIIAGFNGLVSDCYAEEKPLSEIVDKAERFIYGVSMAERHKELVSLPEAITPAIIKLGERYELSQSMTGVPTGFTAIDALTDGLQPSDLIILAARPSMGKTALGLNFAQNAAFRYTKTVAFFSLEMSVEQLILRIISSETEIDSSVLRVGGQTNAEWTRITHLNADVKEKHYELYIDDTSSISAGEIRSKLRKLKSRKGLDLVVIDYLQLMGSAQRAENRNQEISSISRDLKALAKELHVPVVALSQLSRSPEGRKDRRPILSDLRESGAIEQDADIVMMLYRDNYYDREADSNETEVIFAKHRNGEVGTVKLLFSGKHTKFKDLEYAYGLES
ncbi:MAG: replicative DNA helicase [Eubacteriaceae bacterium]|jgi:replicative DNA helicase|nr:replicative DNA helicase [Eubacteriaceae bacterium]